MPFDAYVPIEAAEQVALTPTFVGDGQRAFRLEQFIAMYGLRSTPYELEADAQAAFDELRAAVLWLALFNRIGVRSLPRCGELVAGIHDVRDAAVLPEGPVRRLETFPPGLKLTIGEQNVRAALAEALAFPNLRAAYGNAKLRLAIELYVGHWFEASANMRFITLVTSLESITERGRASAATERAIDEVLDLMAQRVRGRRRCILSRERGYKRDSEEYRSLESLRSPIGALRRVSIKQSLRTLVASVVAAHPDLGDSEDLATRVASAYDTRSTLLHDGQAEGIPEALTFLQDFVPRFLSALFRDAATARR